MSTDKAMVTDAQREKIGAAVVEALNALRLEHIGRASDILTAAIYANRSCGGFAPAALAPSGKAMVTDVERAWNAISDDMNRWDMLSEEERETFIAFAAALAQAEQPVALEDYFERQIDWSRQTFGPALRTKGVIDHIRKELKEIEQDPHDLSEWVDVVILAMDGFWRHGGNASDLLPALVAKQQKNMARNWPDWRTMSEDSAIEHDRSHDAALAHPPAKREAGETAAPESHVDALDTVVVLDMMERLERSAEKSLQVYVRSISRDNLLRLRAAIDAELQPAPVPHGEVVEALRAAEPYVEICHSLISKKDTRAQVWKVLKQIRSALATTEGSTE